MASQPNYDLRALALEKAVQTHGRHLGDDEAHEKRIVSAAKAYENFLKGDE